VGSVIGNVLPLAVGVAISPIALIAVILMLFGPRASATSLGFLFGWVFGILAAVIASVALSAQIEADESKKPSAVVSWIKLLLGVGALVIAFKQWRASLKEGPPPATPKWMDSVEKINLPGAAGMGFAFAAFSPANLALCAAGGITIADGSLSDGGYVVAVSAFAVIACATVVIPVAAYGIAADQVRGPLDSLKRWLEHNNAVVMAVLMLVIGAVLVGKGLGELI
jgi:hypothetical protein